MSDVHDNMLLVASDWQKQGHKIALGIVIKTWGSSPRPIGSMIVIREDGQIAGSVSGGCVEGEVIEAGLACIQNGGAKKLEFGVADETAWQVGLSCGGVIHIWVCAESAFEKDLVHDTASAITARQEQYLACDLKHEKLVRSSAQLAQQHHPSPDIFHLAVLPNPRLVIIGAVHISQHLAPMAMRAGFDVTVIDPRSSFANAERFPAITLICDWPEDAFKTLSLDQDTALITLTHDPKIDDEALQIALQYNGFYIASLGSRKTHQARCNRLLVMGFDNSDIARINGPAGLDIGAKTPAEIAVSMLAECIASYRKKYQHTARF